MKNLFPKRTLSDSDALTLVVEKLRLRAYVSFLVVVFVGILLTHAFANIDLNDSILMQVFGYNNICVYFDYPPASYVLPFLWAITLVLMLQYMVAHWLQMSAQVEEGTLNRKLYGILTRLKLFEAFTVVSFSTIFAVSPEGWDHTLFIHTVPFFLLQVGLVSQATSNASRHKIGLLASARASCLVQQGCDRVLHPFQHHCFFQDSLSDERNGRPSMVAPNRHIEGGCPGLRSHVLFPRGRCADGQDGVLSVLQN